MKLEAATQPPLRFTKLWQEQYELKEAKQSCLMQQ